MSLPSRVGILSVSLALATAPAPDSGASFFAVRLGLRLKVVRNGDTGG